MEGLGRSLAATDKRRAREERKKARKDRLHLLLWLIGEIGASLSVSDCGHNIFAFVLEILDAGRHVKAAVYHTLCGMGRENATSICDSDTSVCAP